MDCDSQLAGTQIEKGNVQGKLSGECLGEANCLGNVLQKCLWECPRGFSGGMSGRGKRPEFQSRITSLYVERLYIICATWVNMLTHRHSTQLSTSYSISSST